MKETFGDRLCIYTVVVGDDPGGAKLLEEVASKGQCGVSVAGDTIFGPQAMADFVERVFLARDTDRDGVPDDIDTCPDTPKGVKVDEKGCPFDTDRDGVYDYLDQCPDTPKGVKVDEKGCPLDSDADGVYDYLDQCPDTPMGVTVDEKGCPLDSDKDGVYDYLDQCPDTPMGVTVDKVGCPLDSDEDGVKDYLDQCPGTPKDARVDERGCWSVGNVLFDFGKTDIKPDSYGYLDEVAEILEKNPSLKVEVQGHTDNVGSEDYNERLSILRAKAVMDYLKGKGIGVDQIPATGYGFSRPVASNDTDEGRAKNRRTEFHPIYSK
ncbi:MAG: OmpA family protein [Deltaproteobacteria bacterium]|nr:OmpA family protein [Deltaproteobacteria bacterium]